MIMLLDLIIWLDRHMPYIQIGHVENKEAYTV